jgi:glycosyltransferase involved in cell wall biosynthesis
LKIGYFVEKFPYFSMKNEAVVYPCGGAEIVAYNLAVNMAKRRHEVYVFTTSANFRSVVENKEGVTISRYGTLFRLFKRNVSPQLILKPDVNVDLVHVHISSEPSVLIATLGYVKRRNVPLVATYHGDIIETRKHLVHRLAVKFHNLVVEKVLDYADAIIVPSNHYLYESTMLPSYKNKIHTVPNGIAVEDFTIEYSKEVCRDKLGLPKDRYIILFLGALHHNKGPHIVIKAMKKIVKTRSDVELIIAGSGSFRTQLENLVTHLKLDKNVRFVGFVKEELKPVYYKAADIFVLSSIVTSEVFPLTLLEASISGLPMVVSDLQTFRCIIEDGYNGFFTKVGYEQDLADTISYLVENDKVRTCIGENARKKAEEYTWEKIAEKTERFYKINLEER